MPSKTQKQTEFTISVLCPVALRPWANRLAKKHVTICFDSLMLKCEICGGKWSPIQAPEGGRMSRDHWLCPHGRCNAPGTAHNGGA